MNEAIEKARVDLARTLDEVGRVDTAGFSELGKLERAAAALLKALSDAAQ